MNALESDERGILFPCPRCNQHNRITYERLGQTGRCAKCHADLPQPDKPVAVKCTSAFDAMIARSALPVVVDFWAVWCGPCRMVAPELDKVASESAGRWIVAKVNTEELPDVAQRFRVSSIPLMAVFEGAREVSRQAGAMPAQSIRQFVEQALQTGVGA
ncbi:thioredoxin [Verrucomicrobiota bacterium sgz303538]